MGHFGQPATMSINLINPPFWETIAGDPDSPASKSQALEVAIVARDALLARSDYDIFQVILTRRHEGAVSVSKYHGFVFRADELPSVVPR